MHSSTTRRRFLHVLALGSGTALLAACAQQPAAPTAAPQPTAAPAPPKPAATTAPAAAPAATAAPAAPAAAPTTAPAAKVKSPYDEIVAAAKREGELSISSVDISSEAFSKAFNQRIDGNIKLNTVNIGVAEVLARVVAGGQSGKLETDFAQVGADTMLAVEKEGLLEPFDWAGTFGQQFPAIAQRAERVNSQYRGGKALELFHLIYIIGYNKDLISQEQLPKKFEDLADPRLKGKFAIDPRGYPFQNLAPFWGEEKLLRVAKEIARNQPNYVAGSPAIAAAIGRGEAPMGLAGIHHMELIKAKNAPVDWFAPAEVPAQVEMLAVLKGAPHPNAARLFAAWLATEGQAIAEREQKTGLGWPETGSYISKRLQEFGAKFQLTQTPEQLQQQSQALKKIEDAYKSA